MRRIWSARRGPVVFVSACLFALAGCGGSDPGPAAPTTMHPGTAVTPTSSTPTGDRTDMATAAAIAAVTRLYAEYNAALTSGNTTEYRKVFLRSCTYCERNARTIDSIARKGQSIVGGAFILSDMQFAAVQPKFVLVQGRLAQAKTRIVKGSTVIDTYPATRPRWIVWRAVMLKGAWVVSGEDVPR
jgi:hypothetical protein